MRIAKKTIAKKITAVKKAPTTRRIGDMTIVDLHDKHRGDVDILEWFQDPSHVYCARPNVRRTKTTDAHGNPVYKCVPPAGHDCKWRNPFKVKNGDHTLEEALAKFEAYLLGNDALMASLGELRGKTLGCWCVGGDGPCHVEILAEHAMRMTGGSS